ncbi:MAG TPA: hypothetical protein VIL60_11060 [Rhodanobacter sp.]
MSRQPTQAAGKRSNPSHLFGTSQGKNSRRGITSDDIAHDIAAFKKRGGRIEVLDNTPRHSHQPATFRSKATVQRKASASKSGTRS